MIVKKKAVVITGASTGIGKATALHLDQLGFEVFAGVRRETDSQALADSASPRLRPLFLDVTDADSIAAGVEEVAGSTKGELFGLINNAGLSLNGPLELVQTSEIEKLFDVNVIGLSQSQKRSSPSSERERGDSSTSARGTDSWPFRTKAFMPPPSSPYRPSAMPSAPSWLPSAFRFPTSWWERWTLRSSGRSSPSGRTW